MVLHKAFMLAKPYCSILDLQAMLVLDANSNDRHETTIILKVSCLIPQE